MNSVLVFVLCVVHQNFITFLYRGNPLEKKKKTEFKERKSVISEDFKSMRDVEEENLAAWWATQKRPTADRSPDIKQKAASAEKVVRT